MKERPHHFDNPRQKPKTARPSPRRFGVFIFVVIFFLVVSLGTLSYLLGPHSPFNTRIVVALDAGHGGSDPGALDASGTLQEADLNRQMLDKVSALLTKQEEVIRVVTTSEPGRYVSPKERGEQAKKQGADFLLSLHLNASENTDLRGFSCFPLPPGRQGHEESLQLAQLITAEVAQAGTPPICGTNGIFYTFFFEAEQGYDRRVMDAADVDATTHPDAPTYSVLQFAGCPALLLEQWYISNEQDMLECYSEEGMNRMAESIYRGICNYYGLTA